MVRFRSTQLIDAIAVMARTSGVLNLYAEPDTIIITSETAYGRATYFCPASVTGEGSFQIDSMHWSEVLLNLISEAAIVDVELKDDKIITRCGTARSTTKVRPVDRDFVAPAPLKTYVRAGGKDDKDPLRDALSEALIFVSSEIFRPILGCVYLVATPTQIKVFGADGYRAFRYTQDAENVEEWTLLVPKPFLIQALRRGDPFVITSDLRERVVISVGPMIMEASAMEGKFPDVEAIIPKAYPASLELYCEDAVKALRRAMVFASDSNNRVRLTITDSNYEFFGVSGERGDALSGFEHHAHPESFEANVNGAYLLDFLTLHERITLRYDPRGTAMSPLLFEDRQVQALVMPMSQDR